MGKRNHIKPSMPLSRHFLIIVFLLLAIVLVFGQVKDFDFISYDDPLYVRDNPRVQQGLTLETLVWSFTEATKLTNYWVPLTWISILLDYQLFGMNAGGFHLTNLFFHILNTVLLFLVLDRMTGSIWRSAFVAALFALHPLHVESVAWVTERKDMLSTFFWMLALHSYISYVRQPGRIRYFLVFLCYVLGLMSKPMLVTLPFVLLSLDLWPFVRFRPDFENTDQRSAFFRLIVEKVPFFILTVLFSTTTFLTQHAGGAVKSLTAYTVDVRIANVLVAYVKYIGKMIWPSGLAYTYPHPGSLPLWPVVCAGVLLLVISFGAVKTAKTHAYVLTGWLWYLVTLAPVSGIVVIGPHAMADRYTYIPLIGLFVIVAWGVPDLLGRWKSKKRLLVLVAPLVLIVLSCVAWIQTGYWKNDLKLYQHAVEVTQNNLTAYINLGVALQEAGRNAAAAAYYGKAVQIDPGNTAAYNNMGLIAKQEDRMSDAIRYYQKALDTNPKDPSLHNNLGNALWKAGELSAAASHYEKAARLNPGYAIAFFNAGGIYLQQGRLDKAISRYQTGLRIAPNNAQANHKLAEAFSAQQRMEKAIFHYREALRIDPGDTLARKNLNIILSRQDKIKAKMHK